MPSFRIPSRGAGRTAAGPAGKAPAGKAPAKAPKKPKKQRPPRAERRAARRAKLSQLKQAFVLTRRNDPRMLPLVLGVLVGVILVFLLLGLLFDHPFLFTFFGISFGLLAATSVFGRRAQRAALTQVTGQPGAALAVVQSMRGQWNVTPVVAATRGADILHRVIGRPGVILIGEGNPSRLAPLLGQEKRRIGRVAAETPVYDIVIGDGDGQVPLRKLQTHLMKLPRNLKPAQIRHVEGRLRALGATVQPPIPKGPMPRNARMPRGRQR